jgi:hypothetical protein
MSATPRATPVIIPVSDPAVATDVLLLVQMPPVDRSVSNTVLPRQMVVGPVIGLGVGLTVTTVVVRQPVLVNK